MKDLEIVDLGLGFWKDQSTDTNGPKTPRLVSSLATFGYDKILFRMFRLHERKTPSLVGDKLERSLRLSQVHLRSEDLGRYRDFFVDNGILERLYSNANQLIVGRRGTGKTHLLGAFHETILEEKSHENEISVLISILDVRPQTPPVFWEENLEFDSKRVARELYSTFLRVFFGRFLPAVDAKLKKLRAIGHSSITEKIWENTNRLLTDLLTEIEDGTAFESERKQVERIRESQKGDGEQGAAVGIKLTSKAVSPSVRANFGRKSESTQETIVETESHSVFAIDIRRVREIVHEILGELNIKTLHILVDEWMELEKRTPSRIQPHFAQLLKATFFNSPTISVKIASVWHETSLYSKEDLARSEGIELGHDIEEAVNLDTAFLNSEVEVINFCKELLFRRIADICKPVRKFEVKGQVDDIFLTELFDSLENFKMFISASHGIPRDLMNIFQKCTLKIKGDFSSKCIDIQLISDVSRAIYRTEKRKRIAPNSKAQELLSYLNEYMSKNDRRTFVVANGQAKSKTLRKLSDEELIHQVPSPSVHRDISDKYKVYTIDFGNYADLLDARRQPLERLLDEYIVPLFPDDISKQITNFLIDVAPFDEDHEKCPTCRSSFPTTHPVFVKFGACPTCGIELALIDGN